MLFPLFLFSVFVFPIAFPIISASASSQTIIINEIALMGTGTSSSDEWIELYNATDQPIDLTNWILSSGDGSPSITFSNKSIPAKGYFLLERTDDNSVPGITADFIYTGALTDSGENLELKDGNNAIIDAVNCVSSGWFAGDKTTKQTMERKSSDVSGNDASNWQTSATPGGTPKAQNSAGAASTEKQSSQQEESSSEDITATETTAQTNKSPIAVAGPDIVALVGQEIAFDASGSSDPENAPLTYLWNFGDGFTSSEVKTAHQYPYAGTYIVSLSVSDGTNSSTDTLSATIFTNALLISEFIPNPEGKDEENEWIEIFNKSDKIINISFWKIATEAKEFSLPANTLISPFSYLVLSRSATKISLPNSNGVVKLLYPNGQISQEIKYEKTKQGQSIAMESASKYTWTIIPTPGAPNIISSTEKPISQVSTSLTAAFDQDYFAQNLILGGEMVIAKTPIGETSNIIIPQTQPSEISTGEDNMSTTNGKTPENNVENQLKNSTNQTQFSSLTDKISSPTVFIPIIIIAGLGAGLGLAKLRRGLKAKKPFQKFTIDWQD